MAQVLQVDAQAKQLQFGELTVPVTGPLADLIITALLSMLPAEKVPMMAPPTTRGYTLTEISQVEYDQLTQAIAQLNTALQAEVLKTNFRARGPELPLQAKILLGEKQVVRSVAQIST
ncbi:hypothetical protein [Candidatus Cyanaurora vandensis]|uniref:hypothetical protein n=1 Tax=Candidatus Cyanaurora vandensis TaxID=2714958 RepID=UPI002579CAC2|nr:hypothetical protein [Candidatus Cyanaurora vandensis]